MMTPSLRSHRAIWSATCIAVALLCRSCRSSITGSSGRGFVRPAGGALQLVAPDRDHKSLRVVEENLNKLRNIPAPIAVLSVVGSIHTGKSFFLNQLMGRPSGFEVGYSVKPQTAGIWLWSEPLRANGVHVLLLDSEGLNAPNVTEEYDAKIFAISTLLSSELLFNTVKFIDHQSLEYLELLTRRANIFGLRAFASHGHGKHGETPQVNETKSFASRGAAEGEEAGGGGTIRAEEVGEQDHSGGATATAAATMGEMIENLLPNGLSWIVQDFVQDLEGAKPLDWLLSLLNSPRQSPSNSAKVPQQHSLHRSQEGDSGEGGLDRQASSISNFFKSVDCLTLPPPTTERQYLQKLDTAPPEMLDPAYIAAVDDFRQRLFERLHANPKSRINRGGERELMSGRAMGDLLNFLVDAANVNSDASAFPQLPSVWESFAKLQLQLTQNDLLEVFWLDGTAALGKDRQPSAGGGRVPPLSEREINETLSHISDRVMGLWKTNIHGLDGAPDVAIVEMELLRRLSEVAADLEKTGCKRIADYCQWVCGEIHREVKAKIEAQDSAVPVPQDSMANFVRVSFERTRGDLEQSLEANGMPFLRLGKCCSPVIDNYLRDLRQLYDELTTANDRAVAVTLASAFEEAKQTMAAPLGLRTTASAAKTANPSSSSHTTTTADAYNMAESEFKVYMSRLEDEALSQFRHQAGNLVKTKRAEELQATLLLDLRSYEDQGEDRWKQHCTHSALEVMRNSGLRMTVNLRRRLPLPTTEENLAAAVAEQINGATEELNELSCRGSAPWNASLQQLLQMLKQEEVNLDQQNVQAIKDISAEPLSKVWARLKVLSDGYFLWFTFKGAAETEGLHTLRRHAQEQNTPLSPALEKKVVVAFVNDDLGPHFRTVAYNLFRRCTLLQALALTSVCLVLQWQSMKWVRAVISGLLLLMILTDNMVRTVTLNFLFIPFSIAYTACNAGAEEASSGPSFHWLFTLVVLHGLNGAVTLTLLGFGVQQLFYRVIARRSSRAACAAGLSQKPVPRREPAWPYKDQQQQRQEATAWRKSTDAHSSGWGYAPDTSSSGGVRNSGRFRYSTGTR